MNPLKDEWTIKHRSDVCTATNRPFQEGEYFYTLLFREADGFRREDLSEEAWASRNENILPFSFWRSRFEPAPETPPEPLGKETAEQLFRRLIAVPDAPPNACYVLAVMLERKRVLKQVRTDESGDERVLVYEQPQTGDVFLVRDPKLRLAELESVQTEVWNLLQGATAANS